MRTLFSCFMILILASAGCRSTVSMQRAPTDVSARTVRTTDQDDYADLPGIGDDLPGIGDATGVTLSAQPIIVSDPLEPMNRAFFHFNDKLYFWVLKPIARGYTVIMPQAGRSGVKNFFANVATPVRLVNCVLQVEFEGAWVELERFAINTTVGVVGFSDPAKNRWNLEKRNEDLGQTLGRYGLGPSIYIHWPILGPSNPRDTVGYVGDIFLDPFHYLIPKLWPKVGIKSYETVNDTSLRVGDYEDFKEASIDPYISLRDAYYQHRRSQVRDGQMQTARPDGALLSE